MVKGRPRLNREKIDCGTPELQKKINAHYPLKTMYEKKQISARAYQAVLMYSYIRYRAHLSMQIKSDPKVICFLPIPKGNNFVHKPSRYFELKFKLISDYLTVYPEINQCLKYLLGESKICPQTNFEGILCFLEDLLEDITTLGNAH